MSEFAVEAYRIKPGAVTDHPNADRLSIIQIEGYTCISAKLEDGSHRYKEGDTVLYIPEGAVVPDWIIKKMGLWNRDTDKGMLSGGAGNRVKAIKLRGIVSQGVIYPTDRDSYYHVDWIEVARDGDGKPVSMEVPHGSFNFAPWLGIKKYEAPIPIALAGNVCDLGNAIHRFDFESIQKRTDMFDFGEAVEITEKLHGTYVQIGYIPGLNHPNAFHGGDVYVSSKGLGNRGLALNNDSSNDSNVYVKTMNQIVNAGFVERAKAVFPGKKVRLHGEIIGGGIQDLNYGSPEKSKFFAFDVQVDDVWLSYMDAAYFVQSFGQVMVPLLYEGPFISQRALAFRDGKTEISGSHIREGIVIRGEGDHYRYSRKIAKWVSPDYLLRKNGTEHT